MLVLLRGAGDIARTEESIRADVRMQRQMSDTALGQMAGKMVCDSFNRFLLCQRYPGLFDTLVEAGEEEEDDRLPCSSYSR
jgi:hypothetical protein